MPTVCQPFHFSPLFWAKPVTSCLLPVTILLLLNSGSGYGQSGTDFTKVFSLSPTGTGVLDMYVLPDGSSRLATIAGYGPAGIELFLISPEGEITNQQYLATGDPVDFKIIPHGAGFITYGTLIECDLLAPPSISLYDSTGNLTLQLLYDDLNIQSFDSLFVLPLSNTDFWIFCTNTPPRKYNAGGFLTANGPVIEPVYDRSLQLSDNQYLVWGNPGLALYNTSLLQKKFSLTHHKILDVSVMDNGRIAALGMDSLWILDNDLYIVKGNKLPSADCIGLETDSNDIYLMYSNLTDAIIYQINENLTIGQIIPVVNTSEMKPGKFRCRNGNLYYTGDNSRSVSGFRKTSLLLPAQDSIPKDGGITTILSTNPVTTYYSSLQGYVSKWSGVSVVVKNYGADVINQITVNSFFSQFYYICLQNFTFSKEFNNLNIQPGESDTLALPDLVWADYMPHATSMFNACFWTKLPNDSLDSDVTNDQFCDQFPIVVGTAEEPVVQNLSVSPNPGSGTVMISLPEMMQSKLMISLFNNLGEEVQRFNYEGLSNIPIHKGFLPAGMYVVKITDAAGLTATGKIIFD